MDDIVEHGDTKYDTDMKKLIEAFKYGKWINVYGSHADYCGRAILKNICFCSKRHQAKLFTERLEPIIIPRGRVSNKSAPTTDSEKTQPRAALGSTIVGCSVNPVLMLRTTRRFL